jgi:methylated-DNA-[protein]-cysteine S-methyltransferase
MSTATWATFDTKIGPFTAVVDADGAVLASGWTASLDELLPQIHPSLRPAELVQGDLGPVGDAITRYHDGELSAVEDVPVRQRSGEFLEHAWEVLRTVPAGAPVTYTEYAAKAGRPAAVRGAGGPSLRPQRGCPVRPVPPRAPHRRHPRRLPLGCGREAQAPGARGPTGLTHAHLRRRMRKSSSNRMCRGRRGIMSDHDRRRRRT